VRRNIVIKGINHSMIELNETGNEYYERAILIIKPEYASLQRALLEREARKMLRNMDAPAVIKNRKRKLLPVLTGVICCFLGMLLGLCCRVC